MIYIGIDPGKSGSITVMKDSKIIRLTKMGKTPKEIYDALKPWGNVESVVYIEKVHAMPRQGVTSMFTFGVNAGHLEMALIAVGLRHIYVTPQKWQKHFGIGTKGDQTTSEWKNKLKAVAERLHPKRIIYLWGSDSVLIAEFGRYIETH